MIHPPRAPAWHAVPDAAPCPARSRCKRTRGAALAALAALGLGAALPAPACAQAAIGGAIRLPGGYLPGTAIYCDDGTGHAAACSFGAAGGGVPTGAAGAPNAAVISMQGIAGGIAVPVSAAALPLPTGASTAANQASMIGSLATIASNTTGAATANNQTAVQSAPGTAQTTALTIQGNAGGIAVPADTVVRATAVDRGAVVGFMGAQIATTSGSATITLAVAPTTGGLVLGQQISASGVPAGTTISALASGTLGAAGSTYTLSASATATGAAVLATSAGPQPLMAANTARRGVQYQNQSQSANCWVNGVGTATADYHSLKIPASNFIESPSHHVGTGAVSVICDTAATPLYAREF